jgi:hypothetical protein
MTIVLTLLPVLLSLIAPAPVPAPTPTPTAAANNCYCQSIPLKDWGK